MTRQEILGLLKELIGAYPNQYIKDAEATVRIWEFAFGGMEAEDVILGARYHIIHSSKFPTPHDILEAIPRGKLVYEVEQEQMRAKLSAPVAPQKLISVGMQSCPLNDHECVLLNDLCDGPEDGKCPFEGI